MRCFFINLDSAAERRARLEESFHASAPPGWSLQRIAAAGAADVAALPGGVVPVVKACFTSHRRAIEAAAGEPGDVLIVEDDTVFCRRGLEMLDKICSVQAGWDLFMTNPGMLRATEIIHYAREREAFERHGRFLVENLAKVAFTGANAYVLRGEAKRRLLALTDVAAIDAPYDVFLRSLVERRLLAGRFPTPFLTSLSPASAVSQINVGETLTIAAVNAFRKLMFIGREVEASAVETAALAERMAPATRLYGPVLAAVIAGDGPPA